MKRLFLFPLALSIAGGLGPLAYGQKAEQSAGLFNEKETLKVLEGRKATQIKEAQESKTLRDFSFADGFPASGITFSNHIVEDACKYFKPAHYDHGTGFSVADVDGDGLPDLFFVNQLGGNSLWRNLGHGKFEDITAASGAKLEDRICVAASFADIDNDGDADLFITTVRMGNVLLENNGKGVFKDISKSAGVDYSGHSSAAVFFDYNRDGLLDLFVCNVGVYTTNEKGLGGYYRAVPDGFSGHTKPERYERSLFYQNLGGGKFKEISAAVNLNHSDWSGEASFADVNEDGFADLYVLSMQGDDHLYLNRDGKKFEEATASFFPKTPWGAMGIKFFDFNQDGKLDLYVTDMHSDMNATQTKESKANIQPNFEKVKSENWCTAQYNDTYLKGASNNIFGNAFYLNNGNKTFKEVSDGIGAETFWPWGPSVGDLNADGYPDIVVTAGMGYGFRYGINSVLLNQEGRSLLPAEFILGVEPRANGRTRKTAFILDVDGADRNHPAAKGQHGKVPVSEALSSRSSAILDLDDDGDQDLVFNEMDDHPQILLSNLSEKHKINFLKIKLQGTTSNRDGLGSMVQVRAGGKTITQQFDGKSGYLAQSSLPLYFGLGSSTQIESVEVLWPSGKKQSVQNGLKPNSILLVTETK